MSQPARVLCINPCLPIDVWPSVVLSGVSLPGGIKLRPSLPMALNANCDSCAVLADFMIQTQPFLMSFQLPLCLLNCLIAVASPTKTSPPSVLFSLKDLILGLPTPSVTDPINALVDAMEKCLPCFVGWTPNILACMLRDILDIIIGIIQCAISLLQKIAVISLRATTMQADSEASIRSTAECLFGLINVQKAELTARLDLISALLDAIGFLFSFTTVTLTVDFSSLSADLGLDSMATMLQNIVGSLQTAKAAASAVCGS